jgi:hypothetical protein
MGFLGDLAGQIDSQLSLGENANHTLDSVISGQNVKYGSLGDFASKFDQSSERRYVEEGYLRRDPFNADPKQFEILMQEPNATVFIKKKMFSSIAENFRPDYMDVDEKLYYKTIKILFANKCAQISALEKLSKIQSVTASAGSISETLFPIIITLADTIAAGGLPTGNNLFGAFGGNPLGGSDASKLLNISDQLRKISSFNVTNPSTTWLVDSSNLFQSQFGKGTGVIELSNFTTLNTNVSVDGIKNAGSFGLTIMDPYEAMLITEWDIEKAIADATNMYKNSSVFQLAGVGGSDQVISDKQARLNQIRSARGASPITIKVNPTSLLGKRVTAIFDRIGTELIFNYDSSGGTGIPGLGGFTGNGVSVSDDYLKGGDIAGVDGLDPSPSSIGIGSTGNVRQLVSDSELSVFNALITAIYTKIQMEANSQNAFQITNKTTNYTRRKMRFNFSGKLIIQPMDIIHIYLSSKSMFDNKLLGGLSTMFNGFGVLQGLNTIATDIKNIGSLLNPKGSSTLQAEKTAYVGSSFPNSLWALLRSQFINEKEGTHVFAGVVDNANDSWGEGKFTVSVSGRDNTVYFDQGKVNFKPGVDVFNGAIYDPLTPFKSNFDTISTNAKDDSRELLDENKDLLGTMADKRGLVKMKSGPDAGKKLASDHFNSNTFIDTTTGFKNRVLFAPDGLVYKWKEGIGVFVQFGSSLDLNDPNKTGNPSTYLEPFAGQDVMNVISLLITGQPYNYSNFWRASNNLYGFGKDQQSQQDSAHTYITSLQNELTKSNILWGNFIPFKNLVIDEKSFAYAQNAQFRVVQRNRDLDAKIEKLKDLNNQAAIFGGAANALTNEPKLFAPQFEAIKSQVIELQKSVQADVDAITNEDYAFNATAGSAGPDATFDYAENIDSSKAGISASNPNSKKELRRQTNFLTRRMSYNVRANEDKNLFIVDDTYDKDYDILAYNKSLTDGIKLYNNDFNSTRDKIANTADLLNLEVFADTQGHIRVRPPQYNRMPSSVFYRMMYLKQAYGIQVFPQFLDDLFSDQIDTLRKRIEILEDLIRLDCAIVNGNTSADDLKATDYILTGGGAASNTGASFAFISDQDSGQIVDINQLMHSTNPDEENQVASFITDLSKDATSNKEIFPNTSRYTAIIKSLTQQNLPNQGYTLSNVPTFNANSYVDQLISRIQTKSGTKINKKDYIVSDPGQANGLVLSTTATIDIFKITKELQEKLQERQKVIRLFYSTLSNAKDFKSLDSNDKNLTNQLLAPAIYGNSHIPEVFEHMIEDESYNDYGGNSGSRYIILRSQIRNIQITETPPEYTLVEVQGVLNTFSPDSLPDGLNSFPQGGNGLVTAAAVDYDMWRNYGFKNQAVVKVPFLSDPNSQCAPYASMILSRARKNILRGSVTISGNEYMQPGEVVYLQDRGLLFYVTAVRHNFGFSNSFTTTLDLTYGHTPGEYIPTTMDVIGKMIYNNRDIAGYTVDRQSNSGNETSLGVVQMDPNTLDTSVIPGASTEGDDSNTPQNSFASFNKQTLDNIMFQAAYLVNANNSKGNNIVAHVELRIYYDDANPINDDLQNFANDARNVLIGQINTTSSISMSAAPTNNQAFPSNSVSVIPINIDSTSDRRSPSQKAIDSARNQVSQNSGSISLNILGGSSDRTTPTPSNDKLRAALFGYIVDCWLSFENVPAQSTGGS